MAKAGDAYRELVGTVMAVLDPDSAVKTEQWIDGPDGERDMDVEVRGMLHGMQHFILVECKDHARPIGIGFVDAFESKIRDLKPNRAIMFSNSGFTRDALKKANRVGIEMASAMKAKDQTIKIGVHHELVARRMTLQFNKCTLFPFEGFNFDFKGEWKPFDLHFDGLPVCRWFHEKMTLLATSDNKIEKFCFICTFRDEPRWFYQGQPLKIAALKFSFTNKMDWVMQNVESEVSLGYFDHIKNKIVIPDKQWYTPGVIDRDAWEDTKKQWEEEELEPNSIRLNLTIMRSNLPIEQGKIPKVDELIIEHRVDYE